MIYKRSVLSLILFSLLVGPAWSIDEDEDVGNSGRSRKFLNLTLGIEQDEKLTVVPKDAKQDGDCKKRGIADASYSKEINTLRFQPKSEGTCILTIKERGSDKILFDYRITVKKSKLDAIAKEIQSLLGDIEGITIRIVNNKVVVDGQIILAKDMSRIYNVISQYGDQASHLVTLSPIAQKKIAEFIARDINNPEIEVRAVNEKIILQGVASSQEEKDRAEIIAKTYIAPVVMDKATSDKVILVQKPANDGVINLITIKAAAEPPPPKMIQLVVHYVELKKDYQKGFRFDWSPTIGDNSGAKFGLGGRAPGGVVSEITGTIANLLPKLNWAKSHGQARVLESTSMIVLDQKTGILNSVTKYPVTTTSPNGSNVQMVDVGIKSTITPKIMGERSDSINLVINFDITSLVGVAGGAPVSAQNNIITELFVRSGQSAAIGGLIRASSGTIYNDPTKTSENPLISLYASKDFRRNQSQFVVFITPIIKSSASAGSDKIKKKFRLRD